MDRICPSSLESWYKSSANYPSHVPPLRKDCIIVGRLIIVSLESLMRSAQGMLLVGILRMVMLYIWYLMCVSMAAWVWWS